MADIVKGEVTKSGKQIQSWSCLEIQQEVERGFDGHFLNTFLDWSCVKDYAYIVHDKDDTRPHIHCMIRFHSPVPTNAILKRCNDIKDGVISYVQLRKIQNWKGAISYLTHKNAPEKHQYDDNAVVSNYDWSVDVVKKKVSLDEVLTLVRDKILAGCSPYDVYTMLDDLDGNVYAKYKNKIEAQIKQSNLIYESKNKGSERNMRVMFFYGNAGTGKSSMAKTFAKDSNLSYYIASCGQHMFDDYAGQDVIILDDLRDSKMRFDDFLKTLDNHIDSNVACRYNNKSIRWCKYLIVTTSHTIEEFYNGLTSSEGEEKKQILRRFNELWHFTPDTVYVSAWDSKQGKHISAFHFNNPVVKYLAEKEKQLSLDTDKLISGLNAIGSALGFDLDIKLDIPVEPVKPVQGVQSSFDDLDMEGFTVIDTPDDLPF